MTPAAVKAGHEVGLEMGGDLGGEPGLLRTAWYQEIRTGLSVGIGNLVPPVSTAGTPRAGCRQRGVRHPRARASHPSVPSCWKPATSPRWHRRGSSDANSRWEPAHPLPGTCRAGLGDHSGRLVRGARWADPDQHLRGADLGSGLRPEHVRRVELMVRSKWVSEERSG